MQFARQYYYEDELQGSVTNRFKLSIPEASKAPLSTEELFFCDRCDFPLIEAHCVFCHFQNPERHLGSVMEQELRNVRFQTQAKRTNFGSKLLKGNRPCYILCIDISGSTVTSYAAPDNYRTPTMQHIINELGKDAYLNLKLFIPEQDIVSNMEYFKSLYSVGLSHADIISEYRSEHGRDYGGKFGNRKAQVYINRKQIIQQGVTKFLELLTARDPEAMVYVVYFNNNILVPRQDLVGYETLYDIDIKFPEHMYEFGRKYAQAMPRVPVRDSAAKIVKNLMNTPAEGQTALGPALVFCFGMASVLNMPLHQMYLVPQRSNIITDGSSNVGFGQTEGEDPMNEMAQQYEQLTLRFGVNNSCMVNIIGFSDEKIGFDKLEKVFTKTNGLGQAIEIHRSEKLGQSISLGALESYLNEFRIYLDRAHTSLTDLRIVLVVNNVDIALKVEQTEQSFLARSEFPNCIDLALGVSGDKKCINVLFEGELQDRINHLKFSTVIDFFYRGSRHTLVSQRYIQIREGSKQAAQQEMMRGLEQDIQRLRLNQNASIEEYKNMKSIMERNPHIVKEDQMKLITQELQQLEILEKKRQATIGKDCNTIRKARRTLNAD